MRNCESARDAVAAVSSRVSMSVVEIVEKALRSPVWSAMLHALDHACAARCGCPSSVWATACTRSDSICSRGFDSALQSY